MTDKDAATNPPSDHDSPWKEALEGWFPEFLALLFPTCLLYTSPSPRDS